MAMCIRIHIPTSSSPCHVWDSPEEKKNDTRYTKENIKQALSDVKNGSSTRIASKENGVPKTTLLSMLQKG